MPTLSVGQEAERALKLLLGLGCAPIAQRMGRYGFTEADRQEGWRRLQALSIGRGWTPAPEKPEAPLLARLNGFLGAKRGGREEPEQGQWATGDRRPAGCCSARCARDSASADVGFA